MTLFVSWHPHKDNDNFLQRGIPGKLSLLNFDAANIQPPQTHKSIIVSSEKHYSVLEKTL
jgi:hypothetical protein